MGHGRLVAIFIAPRKRGDLQSMESVDAIAGRGLHGDRYFRRQGIGTPDQEVTLIESEVLEALQREFSIELEPSQARRNLLTRGVSLNGLVGKEFTVGEVLLRGVLLCEPCGHLEALTQKGIKPALRHRGGLRAEILHGGSLRIGDRIRTAPPRVDPLTKEPGES